MSIAWFSKHPRILGPRWLGLLDLEALPSREGFDLCADQLKILDFDPNLDPQSTLELWRSAQADYPLVLIQAPKNQIPAELYPFFKFEIGTEQANCEWNPSAQLLKLDSQSFAAPTLAKALLLAQEIHCLWQKDRHPWIKNLSKTVFALLIGLCLPMVQSRSVSISPAPKSAQKFNLASKPIAEAEFSARNNFELRKKTRRALFQLGFFSETPEQIAPLLNQKLKAAGISEGFQSEKDQNYSPTLNLRIRAEEVKLKPLATSDWLAYRFFASTVLDSLSYPTDFWWQGSENIHRKHDGVDLAGPLGTRLLAPFSGKLISWKNERAGNVAAVVHGPWIFYFAHCDQILFFDGDSIRAGEAIATIGMTGHTYGPHAHIGVGKIAGKYQGGHPNYAPLNPVEWYVNNRESLKLP